MICSMMVVIINVLTFVLKTNIKSSLHNVPKMDIHARCSPPPNKIQFFLKREDALEIAQTTTLSVENKQLLALIIFVLSVF